MYFWAQKTGNNAKIKSLKKRKSVILVYAYSSTTTQCCI